MKLYPFDSVEVTIDGVELRGPFDIRYERDGLARLKEILDSIELRHFVVRVKISAMQQGRRLLFRIIALVPHRDTGETVPVTFERDINPDELDYPRAADRVRLMVRDALLHMLRHELDEAWHVNGVRVNDPHAKDGA